MKYWFTADLHLAHHNIIKYCDRPFKDVDDMNEKLIRNWNTRVAPEDTVFHLGDFCFRGNTPLDLNKNQGMAWEEQLNGKLILLKGNHDGNNGLNTIITDMLITLNGKTIFMTHIPPEHPAAIPDFVDFVLCGHIHQLWKKKIVMKDGYGIPLINVGTDVWNYRPVGIDDIMAARFKEDGE